MTTQPETALRGGPKKILYPFAEVFEGTTNGITSVALWDIPAGTIITMVMARIKTAGVGTGNLLVGDDDDDNGFVLAGDATATAGTKYGDKPTERGVYLEATAGEPGDWKVYEAAGKELRLDCDAATLTTEAVVEVFVVGFRWDV